MISAFTLLGLIFRLLATSVMAKTFGTSSDLDAYFSAVSFPNYLLSILASAVSLTCLPLLTEIRAKQSEHLNRIFRPIFTLITGFFFAISFVLFLFSDPACRLLAPGFSESQLDLMSDLFRVQIFTVAFSAAAELLSSRLYLERKFFLPSFLRALSGFIFLIGVVLFAERFGVTSLVYSGVVGGAVQTLALFAAGWKDFFSGTDSKVSVRPHIKEMIYLSTPLILGMLTYRALPVFERWAASELPAGSIGLLSYANRIMEIPQQLLISGAVTSLFPIFSEFAATGQKEEVNQLFRKALRFILFLYIPLATFLFFLGEPLVSLFLQRGAFTAADSKVTFELLQLLALGLPAMGVCGMIGQAYYIHKDTKTVAVLGIGESIIYVLSVLALRPYLHIYAFPVAYSLHFILAFFADGATIQIKFGYNIVGAGLKGSLQPILAAATTLLIILGLQKILSEYLPMPLWFFFAFLVYIALQYFVFKSNEAQYFLNKIARRRGTDAGLPG